MKTTFAIKTKFVCTLLLTVGLLASCEHEPNSRPDEKANSIALTRTAGTSQGSRIKSVTPTKARIQKKERLTWVADIKAPSDRQDLLWSATSIAFHPDNDSLQNRVYITWHSNRQATKPATAWGGAIDIIDMSKAIKGGAPVLTGTYTSYKAKFNHVMVPQNGQSLFLSATTSFGGGAVVRAPLAANRNELNSAYALDLIGFPGASVNAIAEYNGKMLAVSGFKGTYATFDPNMEAVSYSYTHPDRNDITPIVTGMANFGGKYVLAANGNAYVLHDGGQGAAITDMSGKTIQTDVTLKSAPKFKELYNEETGEWVLSGEQSTAYGKHTMAIKGDYAYIACGYNGMIGVNLSTGNIFHRQNLMTVGLCVYDTILFAATSMGLRVYTIAEDGSLELYAYEVQTYNPYTGEPTSVEPASISTPQRHSPNFVTYDPSSGLIYVAYGQSGVKVYKWTYEAPDVGIDMGEEVIWAPVNIEGYYAWGEIFCLDDPAGFALTFNGVTRYQNAAYYPKLGRIKTLSDHINFKGYHFFDGTTKLPKYQWKTELDANGRPVSQDGKTVLDPEDDVVTVRLGEGWRMPTKEEWMELLKLGYEIKTVDGKVGLAFKAENGNELFLPQTGYYGYPGKHVRLDSCYYWTSSLSDITRYDAGTGKVRPGGECQAGSYFKNKNLWVDECKAACVIIPVTKAPAYLWEHDRCCAMAIRAVRDKNYKTKK